MNNKSNSIYKDPSGITRFFAVLLLAGLAHGLPGCRRLAEIVVFLNLRGDVQFLRNSQAPPHPHPRRVPLQ